MILQEGDIVRFLNEVGGGEVTKIIDAQTIEVTDDSGFSLPIRKKDVVFIERPEKKWSPKDEQIIIAHNTSEEALDENNEEIENNDNPHILLAFVRDAKNTKVFSIHIINDSNYCIFYVLSRFENEKRQCFAAGQLDLNSKLELATISYEQLGLYENLNLSAVLYKKTTYIPQKNIDKTFPIHATKFYKPGVFVVNDFFDEDAYVIDVYNAQKENDTKEITSTLTPEKLQEAMLEKKDSQSTKYYQQKIKKEKVKEIDLHIVALVEDDSKMTPFEKLELQLRTFEKELQHAVTEGYEQAIFIHGVGQGILKAKIRGLLDKNYPQYFYQDASFQKYKYGATLVYFRKVTR